MSQLGNMGAPTPRRSTRISEKGTSVVADSAITTITNGGTRVRRKGPLTKVKARKSNAYGASGRVGAAEDLAVSATGFAQAFQNQRGDAFGRDEDAEEEEDDDVDELGLETPLMSGALNGHAPHHSPSPVPEVDARRGPGLSFLEMEGVTMSDDDLAASVGNTSKSFGPRHEAGMLSIHERRGIRLSPQGDLDHTPLFQKTSMRRMINIQAESQAKAPTPVQVPFLRPATPERRPVMVPPPPPAHVTPADRTAIEQQVDELMAEERARLQREGPPPPQPEQHSQRRRRHHTNPQVVDDWLVNVEPHPADEAEWRWRKPLLYLFWGLVAFGLGSWFLSSSLASEYADSTPRVPNLFSAVGARVTYTMGKVAEFIQPPGPPPEMTEAELIKLFKDGEDDVMWRRMSKMDRKYNAQISDVRSSIDKLKEELPEYLVLRQHEDGHREIGDDFWHALVSKVRSKKDDPEWNEYLKEHVLKIESISGVAQDGERTKSWDQIVSRHEFAAAMENHYQNISARVDEQIYTAIRSQSDQIKTVVLAEAKKTMIDNLRLHSLAHSNLVANYELRLSHPNYFSPALGAKVEPALTSATYLDDRGFLNKFARKLAIIPQRNPPKVALHDWREPGDCWCSAPNSRKGGQAQLVVALGRPMTPKQVTIEHVPKAMVPTRNISNAPRRMEFWVETDAPTKAWYNHHQGECEQGPPGWKCLGSFKYNIHAGNYQQTFSLTSEPSQPITRAMLRATNNWGADHTCLYQVRLHGDDAAENYEYEVGYDD